MKVLVFTSSLVSRYVLCILGLFLMFFFFFSRVFLILTDLWCVFCLSARQSKGQQTLGTIRCWKAWPLGLEQKAGSVAVRMGSQS